MKKSSLTRVVWIIALAGLMFASFGPTIVVLAQGQPPVDPTGPVPQNTPDAPGIPITGGEADAGNEGLGLSPGTLVAIFGVLFVILIIALLVGDGLINRVD